MMLKEYAIQAMKATTPTPAKSFTRPNRATPATYSHSFIGVTSRLSTLRDQVSSSTPVASAICAW